MKILKAPFSIQFVDKYFGERVRLEQTESTHNGGELSPVVQLVLQFVYIYHRLTRVEHCCHHHTPKSDKHNLVTNVILLEF